MSFTAENIYKLLPAIYRIRDEQQGSPLKGFIEIVADKAIETEANIAELYENWFIETCKEWVVPYIGDLLGVKNLHTINGTDILSQRAYVANTLSYRRRKGIAPVLEQLSLDVAGWRAHVTEFFELLQATQNPNHVRSHCMLTPDLRKMEQMDLLNSAFDTITHTVNVRHISSGRGRYNIKNVGLFIWRIQAYPVKRSDARKMNCLSSPSDPAKNFFTFNPLGYNAPLFNRPQTENDITHISEEINVPALLRRRALFNELENGRQASVDGKTPVYNYFNEEQPVFEIFSNESKIPVSPQEILICNLETCCDPPLTKQYKRLKEDGTYEDVGMPITVVVDPVTGRFIFTDRAVGKATVNYCYGFSGDTGAGVYNRQASLAGFLRKTGTGQTPVDWHAGVTKETGIADGEKIFDTLQAAIDKWKTDTALSSSMAIITIMDSRTYEENIDIEIDENCNLLIAAAQWPERKDPETLVKKRITGDFVATGLRPHIKGNISIKGLADEDKKTGGSLTLNGLLVEGKLSIHEGNLSGLVIAHSTLIPGKGGLEIGAGSPLPGPLSNQWLALKITRSITGPLLFNNTFAASLLAEDSIIDNAGAWAIGAVNIPATFKRTTVFGETHVKTINAENCIFNDIVEAKRRQTGCLRFSFAPITNSATPRRYHCQPNLEINIQIAKAEIENGGPLLLADKTDLENSIMQWLVPEFTSVNHYDYGYAQLRTGSPLQIITGADDGAEMGVFCFLKQPQRMANLRIAVDEYLPLGLEAGFIYIT